MSPVKQRVVYRAIKPIADTLIKALAKVVPTLKAKQIYYVAPPTSKQAYSPLPLNFSQLTTSLKRMYKNIFYPEVAGVFILKRVNVSWQGAVFKNFSIFSPTLHPATEHEYKNTFLLKQWFGKKVELPASEEGIALVYNQYSAINYYHWIIETLPRLLILREKYPNYLLLVPQGAPEYMKTSAAAFGFERIFELNKEAVLQVPNLIIPYATPSHWRLPFGYEERGVLNEVRKEIIAYFNLPDVAPTRRIYISRSRASARRLVNEEAVQDVVKRYGFEVIFFEGMTFRQQVALMQETKVLLGVHGANLANLLFMQAGSKVIEVMSEKINNLTYYRIASYLSLGYYSLPYEVAVSELDMLFSDAIADIGKLEEILSKI
jgi:hypothetical protein